jgi:hypothetical protein
MGSNRTYLKLKKAEFMKKWECRDLGEAKEYLGMRITRDRIKKTLKLDQISYAEKVIKRFQAGQCQSRPDSTSIRLQSSSQLDSIYL